ncbi:sensor histidine kinase [Flavobacterium suncheonense]|uniref:histidine kinase n=1 Tax=Flavobacterium suncheonense GH29-5 = DSM 17707 TaxID=1121899 RepID=A0A0A2M3J7_9FLAO|nr:HAMP domain-containing sensor histidine kinase [Flavobacterium suncheonense]KGO87182.1 histidine kinase [Flavobacterium suncheonense GH29-5 = DSM 17707]
MKLLNKSLIYLSVSLFFVIGLWTVVFYFNMFREIKESIDEGLENYKRQIIYQAQKDPTILNKKTFAEGFFAIREISQAQAVAMTDTYTDTIMLMQDADDEAPEPEPVRLLKTAFENHGKYYELRVINSMVEEDDLVKELFREALGLYLLLIAIIIFINNFVLQRLWKPFYSFLNQLKKYRIGNKFPEVKTETQEFNDLQKAVTILLQRNAETYEQQKQFIGNASHELQTPLAIATNKLELLIEKGNLQPEQAENIAETINIIERLVRLNKSLLLLTKIENNQFLDNKTVSFNEVVKQSVNDLEEIADYKNVTISVSETSELTAHMNLSLAYAVVSNLLRNAVFHNTENGTVTVTISEKAITIRNTGSKTPISETQLFSRFHKTESNTNGTGLGLAIVKAICDLYEFPIVYRFENDLHCFELRIK